MSELYEYIESYFQGELNDTEKRQFEERCIQDESFARQVALFITSTEGIRQKLLDQKKQEWAGNTAKEKSNTITPVKKMIVRKWMPYAAAACLILTISVYYLFYSRTPQQLASNYVKEHFMHLSQTMNASSDSLQLGIAAYNNKDYNTALQLFEAIYQSHPEQIAAKKYTGLVYLVTKDYDKAIQQFDELTETKDLYKNPGLFLKAVTLLERNEPEDKAQAKKLLEQVVNEKAEGSKEAEKWLKKW